MLMSKTCGAAKVAPGSLTLAPFRCVIARPIRRHTGSALKNGDDPELQRISRAEYGKDYSDLNLTEQRHVYGKKGAAHRWADHEKKPHHTGAEDAELQAIAQADYGKNYEDLSLHEKRHCAGKKGMAHLQMKQDAHVEQDLGAEHKVLPLEGPQAETLMQEYPDITSHEQKRVVGTGGTPMKDVLKGVAQEEFASRWEDLTAEERARAGRLVGADADPDVSPESGPRAAA